MDKRTEFVERLSAQIVAWDVQIDMLRDRAVSATPEVKFELHSAITALQLKRDEAAEKLQKVSTANDDEWEEIKSGSEKVWDEISTIFHDTIVTIK